MINFQRILDEVKKYYKEFKEDVKFSRVPKNFYSSIIKSKEMGRNPIIAEIKFCSPKGRIREFEDVKEIAKNYIKAGACGISVLTERKFFCGDIKYLKEVSSISPVPVLRKDFIFTKSQVYESYHYGADSILVISSLLNVNEIKDIIETSRKLMIEPIIEVHTEEDIDKIIEFNPKLVMINNRDKDTLEINLRRTERLSKYVRMYNKEILIISASGISSVNDLKYVLKYADAALIGTRFMREKDLYKVVSSFVLAK